MSFANHQGITCKVRLIVVLKSGLALRQEQKKREKSLVRASSDEGCAGDRTEVFI